MHLILLADFLQVLSSESKFYTKRQYFPKHNLFYAISLLQEERLNPINYSKQELIMGMFVWAVDHDMQVQIFVTKYFSIWVLVILYNALLSKLQ
jgi:hypothetical protein